MNNYKLGKAQLLLLMYECLLDKRYLFKSDFEALQKLPPITFKRYVYEIQEYLVENDSDYEIKYSRKYKAYRLLRKEKSLLNPAPIFAIGAPRANS